MVAPEIIRRFAAKIKENHNNLNESTIEKDFYLTLLLNEMSRNITEDESSLFSKLVFKGGTLLTRTHLQYHRISEDLDFTYSDNKKLHSLSSKQRNKFISLFTSQLAEKLSEISRKHGMNFIPHKADKKYCKVLDRKSVYLFSIHYSPVYGTEDFIKFEVNFHDKLLYQPILEDIKHLFDEELLRDLEFVEGIVIKIKKNIPCYDMREVAMEKIRAVLTRPAIKERDLLDLFLLSEIVDPGTLNKEKIIAKITGTVSFVKGLSGKIQQNMVVLANHRHNVLEEKDKLALIPIDAKKYVDFEEKMIPFLIEIEETALEKMKK